MPFKSAMMTSEMSMSGANVGTISSAPLAGVDGASLKAALVQNHGQGIGNYALIVDDKDFRFRLCSQSYSPAIPNGCGILRSAHG